MERGTKEDWSASMMGWFAILIWFSASLLSQVAYIASTGMPYEADAMLDSLGSFAWIIIGVEAIAWFMVVALIGSKAIKRHIQRISESHSQETVAPQA
jgi:hypothetical protein